MCKSSTTSTQGRSPATAQFLLLGFMLTSDFLTSQVPRSQTLRCQHRGLQSAVHFGETRAALQARTRRRSTNKRSSFILYSCTCVLSTRSRSNYANSGHWRGPTRSKLKVGQQAPKSKWSASWSYHHNMRKTSTTSTQGRSASTTQCLLLSFMLTSDFLTSQMPRSQALRCQHRGLQSAVHFGETRAALQARTRRRSTNKRSSFILYSCTCALSTRSRPI